MTPQPGDFPGLNAQLEGDFPEDLAARLLPETQFVKQALGGDVVIANLRNKSADILHKGSLRICLQV